MKTLLVAATVAFGLLGTAATTQAQWGGPDRRDFRESDRDFRDRDFRDRDFRGRDRDFDDRRGRGGRQFGFDEGEYLRCNPDVRRAVARGQMESGAAHYQRHGRREGRRTSC